jgi:hypothetical protein
MYVSRDGVGGALGDILSYNGSSFDTFIAPGSGGMDHPNYFTFDESTSTPEPGSILLVVNCGLFWFLKRPGQNARH